MGSEFRGYGISSFGVLGSEFQVLGFRVSGFGVLSFGRVPEGVQGCRGSLASTGSSPPRARSRTLSETRTPVSGFQVFGFQVFGFQVPCFGVSGSDFGLQVSFFREGQRILAFVQGYLAHKKSPPPLGPP